MTDRRRTPVLSLVTAAVFVLLVSAWLSAGWSEEGVRIVVRWTAKIALLLFAAAFSASSLRLFWRSGATRWLIAHRRRLGLAFAFVMTVHLLALVVLGVAFPSPFVDGLNAFVLVGGGLGYALMFAMAATSNDASVRRLGVRRWRMLHTVGGWYLWVIFLQSYLGRVLVDPTHAPYAVLLFAVLGVRVARRLRERGGEVHGAAAA